MANRVALTVLAALLGPVIILGLLGLVLQGFDYFMEHGEHDLLGIWPWFKIAGYLAAVFLCGRWGWKAGARH